MTQDILKIVEAEAALLSRFRAHNFGDEEHTSLSATKRASISFGTFGSLMVTHLDMVSLVVGWDFFLPLRHSEPALPNFIVYALRLHMSRGVRGIARASSHMLRGSYKPFMVVSRGIEEIGSVETAAPARA